MKKITIISLTMVLIVGLYIGANSNKSESPKKQNDKAKNSNSHKVIALDHSGYKEDSDPLKVPAPYVKKSSIAEAEKNVPFKIKLPSINLGVKINGIYSYEDSWLPQDRRIEVVYDNGLKIAIKTTPDLPPIGPRTWIAKYPALANLYSDPDYIKVQVNGAEAVAREPGDYVGKGLRSRGEGHVIWRVMPADSEDELEYKVSHPSSLSVKALIKIAESIPLN